MSDFAALADRARTHPADAVAQEVDRAPGKQTLVGAAYGPANVGDSRDPYRLIEGMMSRASMIHRGYAAPPAPPPKPFVVPPQLQLKDSSSQGKP